MNSAKDKKAQNEKMVVLEGKSRLPVAIQEMINDFNYSLKNIQNPPLNPGEQSLNTVIKNFACLDVVLDNSTAVLDKLLRSVNGMLLQNDIVDHCILEISDVQAKFQSIEKDAYYSLKAGKNKNVAVATSSIIK